ncbi:RNP-1 like RNA-binding protein [Sulfurifustis variabilis]|uniref:RNP-1 like RNA-binding protein n=1 Tax=Sulfurifustis variabilis TaxID=1675686 RepID=A0A1B4V4N5_9GAMM|nr:hypothetical protein [Sulfurifustis variabilis]BAU47522.1 RNP-1 like RNA-binding protein [Sulfurifustis variabilis]
MAQPTDVPARTAERASSSRPHSFKVALVEKIGAPDGAEGKDWYRYVLESGRSTITGQRRGSRDDVYAYATQCAEQLNTRALAAASIWNPRGRRPATPTA